MAIRLSFETGALAGTHILTGARAIRLGRDPESNDLLLTTAIASRRHAVVQRTVTGAYSLELVGSGPSKLNGEPIVAIGGQPAVHMLATGDRIDLGGVEFRFAECEVKLICVSGKSAGRELVLTGPTKLGSDGDCELVLDDPHVAPLHIEIESMAIGFKAVAHAPTTFNGGTTSTRILAHGDEIIVGGSTLRCSVEFAGSSDADADDSSGASLSSDTTPTITNAVGELVFISGTAKGDRIPLGDAQIILGTRADCTFILNDPLASSLHCAISKADEHFVATDLGSAAGTFVNGERIMQGTALVAGDLIAVGAHVLEARMLGGVAQAVKDKTLFTTMTAGAGSMPTPKPRFVIDGRVVSQKKLVLGRAPSCDIIVDDPVASREHAAIEWDVAAFFVRDSSSHGTYVDDKRVVKQSLGGSCVLRLGNTLFRIAVRGEVCTIERADAALAQAALEVARAHASMTRAIDLQAAHSTGGANANPMKTVFRMEGAQLELEIAARKKDLKRNAPAWRPSSDLTREAGLRGAVVLAVIGAIALCGGTLVLGSGRALLDHALSEAHHDAIFSAAGSSGITPCAACHRAGARVDPAACTHCHATSQPRKEHHALDCGGCHREHEGAPAGTALGAEHACEGCHPAQHAKEFAGSGAPQKLAAKALPATTQAFVGIAPTDPRVVALHVSHAKVGALCTACHATQTNGQLAEAKPGLACFRCHQGGADAKAACERCHGREHAAMKATGMATGMATAVGTATPVISTRKHGPQPLTSLAWAFGLALVGGAPSLLFGTWVRMRRGRRATRMVEELKAHPAEVVKRLVHSINDSKCVGCGLCVQACPASVLELVDHKSRVVNFDSCIQCKRCEHACAFDALRMHDADKPPPMIPMPSIDAFHETPIEGMFLIGQASGTPQVKNASNLGRAVIQRIVQRGFKPGSSRALGCEVDVVIVGSGPAGLSAALTAVEAGLTYVVLEKEREFSWTIRNYYHKGKAVMAEPNDVALEATLPHWDSSREELLGAWQELIVQNQIDIRFQHNVTDIKKDGARFVVTIGDAKANAARTITAPRVVVAIGTLGNPRKLGCPGDELEKVKNSLVDPDEWHGKSILVVGGSDSAVEVVLALCKPEANNKVYFSTRGAKLEGIKPKNRKLIEDALAAKRFEMRYATSVADVTSTTVALTFKEDGRREELRNDVVFAMIGGNSPQKWLQQLGIPYVDKPHSWSPPRTDILAQQTAEGLVQLRRLPRRALPAPRGQHLVR